MSYDSLNLEIFSQICMMTIIFVLIHGHFNTRKRKKFSGKGNVLLSEIREPYSAYGNFS